MKKLIGLALLCLTTSVTAAQLKVGDNIRILTINGEPVSSHKKELNLNNGAQVLGLKFESLIVLSNEDHRFYRSKLHYLRVQVSGDNSYLLDAPTNSIEEAEAFSKAPEFKLTDSKGNLADYKVWSREQLINKLLLQ